MPEQRIKLTEELAERIRGLHPQLKGEVRQALEAILRDPHSGKALRDELKGLRSFRVRRFRIVYRIKSPIEIVSIGPRQSIYQETLRLLNQAASPK